MIAVGTMALATRDAGEFQLRDSDTPKGAQGKRTAGIGVQFSDQDRGQTQKKIETYLAGALAGDKATHTM